MIREATIEDVENCVGPAQWFHGECRLPGVFDPVHFVGFWRTVLGKQMGAIYIREVSGKIVEAIGVVIHPDVFTGDSSAQVAFWFVEEASRCRMAVAKLFFKMLRSVKELGAKHLYVCSLVSFKYPQMRALLERFGFKARQVTFTKDL